MGRKREEMANLFVGNLSWETTSESLAAELGKYGTVNNCDTGVVRNGRTRGWAIVEMGTADEAAYVIQTCDGSEFEGRPLAVHLDDKPKKEPRAPRNNSDGEKKAKGPAGGRGGDPALEGKAENSSGLQVVVRNLPWSVTSEMLQGTFEQIGEVTEAVVVCHADSGRSKGWGTVRFTSPSDAADAIARFGGVELAGRPMTIMMDRFE